MFEIVFQGLPDGIFSNQKFKFYGHLVYFTAIWSILQPFGLFYIHLVYFTAIWYILCTFGMYCGNLVYFIPFWYVVLVKIWQPWSLSDRIDCFKIHGSSKKCSAFFDIWPRGKFNWKPGFLLPVSK
jgi:hypothetical protein